MLSLALAPYLNPFNDPYSRRKSDTDMSLHFACDHNLYPITDASVYVSTIQMLAASMLGLLAIDSQIGVRIKISRLPGRTYFKIILKYNRGMDESFIETLSA